MLTCARPTPSSPAAPGACGPEGAARDVEHTRLIASLIAGWTGRIRPEARRPVHDKAAPALCRRRFGSDEAFNCGSDVAAERQYDEPKRT